MKKPDGGTSGSGGTGAGGTGAAPDAGPMVPTVCADMSGTEDAGAADLDGGAAPSSGMPMDCRVVSDLHLQYLAADTNTSDNQIKPHFNIVNHGTRSISLTDLTIRYWYSEGSSTDLTFWCDYAQIGNSNVKGSFGTSSAKAANRYLELSFTGGSLAASGQTGEIQARFNKNDWSNFDESDDYSFDPSKTSFADWYRVTLYRQGVLVWGEEPQ